MRVSLQRALALAGLAVAALVVSSCAGDERPIRIGVLSDCEGLFRGLDDSSMAGAELPLIERGARLRGIRPSEGITSANVAGRAVELVRGCTEGGEYTTIVAEARRLVELEDVDTVVGGTWPGDGIMLREVARLYPDVAFVPVLTGPREVTLHDPARNLFRFAPDQSQVVAGLATYAYRDLGWRRVAVVSDYSPAGWEGAAAFVAELCALGGRLVREVTPLTFDPSGKDVDQIPRDVDGVAVLASTFFGPTGFLRRLARQQDDPARRILVGPYVTQDAATLSALGDDLRGVVGMSILPPVQPSSALSAHRRAFAEAFPGLPASLALAENVIGYRNAVEAVALAIERADGDAKRLRGALGSLRAGLLGGTVQLDRNRQAVVSTSIVRLDGGTSLLPVRTVSGVDQTIGGVLSPSITPTAASAAAQCRQGTPPPWAR